MAFVTQAVKGQATENLVPDIIRQSIAGLPIAKRMRWGSFTTEFVRPVHWAVLLYGDRVINTEVLGLETGSVTQGHAFMRRKKLPWPSRKTMPMCCTNKVALLPILNKEKS